MTKVKTDPFPAPDPADTLLLAARHHVLQLWNERHDARLVYHNFVQAAGVSRLAGDIAQREELPGDVAEIARLAGWFYNTGYLYDPNPSAEANAIRAEFFLAEQHCAPEKIQRVRQCIVAALTEQRPKTGEAQVLSDAIRGYDWVDTFESRMPLLRLEREFTEGQPLSDADWKQYLLQQLQRGMYFTAYAKMTYETALAGHIQRLHQPAGADKPAAIEKSKSAPSARFERLTRRPLRTGIQTYFRVNYANHIRLSAIADNKAHIMISVNSILMSVAISMLTYHQSAANKNPLLVLPIVLFLVTSLTSLIFAVLSSRPRVTSFVPVPDRPANPVFFGNFVHLTLDQYEAAVDAMLRDGTLLFGNMARDLYSLGQVLNRKYRLLMFSYTVFMMGFVATVAAFLGAYFLG